MMTMRAVVVLLSVFLCGWLAAMPAALAQNLGNADADSAAIGDETPWPHSVPAGDDTLTLYQPQLDNWDGYTLRARSAVQARIGKNSSSTQYGIVALEANTLTDKGRRVVTIDRIRVTKAEFPAANATQVEHWNAVIAQDLIGKSRQIALDRLEAALSIQDTQEISAGKPLRNTPPHIVFSTVPSLLVYIDGAPAYRKFGSTPFERVINTRPLLLRDSAGTHHLKVFDGWMTAPRIDGPWTIEKTPGTDLQQALDIAKTTHSFDPLSGQASPDQPAPQLAQTAPAIFVASVPTELLVTDGAPNYVPIANTKLLYVANTTGHIFKDIADNKTYVLVSGRWFRAPNEGGPWEFVAANQLPRDFANIPDENAKENVKASVSGTPQAREAAIAVTIPQTAQVKIAGTTMSPPLFDGEPKFAPIEGTTLQYANNTATPIVRVASNSFYAVENGVWFTAISVHGPWSVATSVPSVIYTIPPSAALYYVTFVRIYAVVDGTVYVGYTSGYQGVVVDPTTRVVVYGTGYAYDPWIDTVWYGPPCTYGFGAAVAYTPWTGWAYAFGFGWAWGASTIAVGWGWGPYPWWGPWGWGWAWGPPVYPWYPAWGVAYGSHGGAAAWGPGGWAGYSGNIYQNWGNRASVSRVAGGYNAWTGNAWASRVGMSYNSRTGIAAAGQRGAVENVYTGNFAAGSRGVATGPGGNVVAGERGVVGNTVTGNTVSGGRGVVYDRDTGQVTHYGRATGEGGGSVVRYGDDVYAGRDGNIYRHNNADGGWEQHTGNGWQQVPGSAQGEATRRASGGLGAAQTPVSAQQLEQTRPAERTQQLEREHFSRDFGAERVRDLRGSTMQMHRSFGGFRGRR